VTGASGWVTGSRGLVTGSSVLVTGSSKAGDGGVAGGGVAAGGVGCGGGDVVGTRSAGGPGGAASAVLVGWAAVLPRAGSGVGAGGCVAVVSASFFASVAGMDVARAWTAAAGCEARACLLGAVP
jgi:hypothetical protein